MHLMIDLETLSTSSTAAITQIGLAPFVLDRGDVARGGIRIDVDPQSCIDLGLAVDWPTMYWWLNQSDAARKSLPAPGKGLPLQDALRETSAYVQSLNAKRLFVWSNGATFDIPILAHAYRVSGLTAPWRYDHARDTRTIQMLAPSAKRPQPKVKHDALQDARAQAVWVQNMYGMIRDNMSLEYWGDI